MDYKKLTRLHLKPGQFRSQVSVKDA